MKTAKIIMIFLWVSLLFSGCKKNQILGTWEGTAFNPEDPPRIDFVLNVTEENGELKGVISDNMGFMDNAPLQEIKIEKNSFSCVVVTTDYSAYRITFSGSFDPKEKILSGKWELPAEGIIGDWKCTKKAE